MLGNAVGNPEGSVNGGIVVGVEEGGGCVGVAPASRDVCGGFVDGGFVGVVPGVLPGTCGPGVSGGALVGGGAVVPAGVVVVAVGTGAVAVVVATVSVGNGTVGVSEVCVLAT